jgi:predicted ArsR family transcriptional regulator
VRVHLEGLRRAGLVDYRVERRGVGKPRHVYSITSSAENLLSVGYVPTLDALLDAIQGRLKSGFTPFLRQVGKALAERHVLRSRRGIPAAVRALESLGASVSVKRHSDGRMLTTQCCPLAAITRDRSEVCDMVASLLTSASGLSVRDECVRGEHPRCHFVVE